MGRDARSRARLHLLTARSGLLFVVLFVDDTVQFYDAASLDFAREFDSVKDLQIGDLWNCGSDQARLVLADGSEVVTDLGPTPFVGKPDGKAAHESCSALSRQLTAARGAVSDAFADVAAIDNLIDSFCSEINSASRPSLSDNDLVAKVISTGGGGCGRSASVLRERAAFVRDLQLEWNPGRLVFWARPFAELFNELSCFSARIIGTNLVLALTVTNISSSDIFDFSICTTTRVRKFVYSVGKVSTATTVIAKNVTDLMFSFHCRKK